jgi:hypothetical protein
MSRKLSMVEVPKVGGQLDDEDGIMDVIKITSTAA